MADGILTDPDWRLRDLITPGWRKRELDKLAELAARRAGGMAADPAAAAAPSPPPRVVVDQAGVRDGAGWFNAPAPRPTAPTPAAPTGAPSPWGAADEIAFQAQMTRAGLDPGVFDEIARLRVEQQRQQEALAEVPDPYNRANLAFGKTAALPYRAGAYGTVNQATGETAPSRYAAARELWARNQAAAAAAPYIFGSWGAGNRFTGEQRASDQALAATDAQLAAAERSRAGVESAGAMAEKARRVQLADGTLVYAAPGPDGRLRVVPYVDDGGRPVQGRAPAAPTPAREYARGDSPQTFLAKQYAFYRRPLSAGGGGMDEERAAASARADVARVFPEGAPGGPSGPSGPSGPAAGGAPGPDPLSAAIAALEQEARDAIRQRPDQADAIRQHLATVVAGLRAAAGR